MRGRLAREYFWHLVRHGHWKSGHREAALDAYRRAIALDPLRWKYWKTYVLARFRCIASGREERA